LTIVVLIVLFLQHSKLGHLGLVWCVVDFYLLTDLLSSSYMRCDIWTVLDVT